MDEIGNLTKSKLSNGSKIGAIISIAFSLFLSINSFFSFYKLKIVGERIENYKSSFFTENSWTWAHLVFGLLFLGGIYISYIGLKEKKSFNIYMSFVYIFAMISLFISYKA